ncbi:MAG TPA: MmgE/PrpD family protein [Vicinamibacterales bacterium]|jgi:2-methylcitrate dehydratase PrpD|nr:MmgE/PrpD family protein [Vicinamibacterales bacterium]
MGPIDRRDFVGAGALGLFALVPDRTSVTPSSNASAPEIPENVTRTLAAYVVHARPEDLPVTVRDEARRTLLNWAGCTVGGSRHETVDVAVRTLAPFSGKPQASLLGRPERVDILHASLINGISSHVLDFDDTHLKTVIHPAGPVASAILALAEQRTVSGRDFLHALVIGAEVECRIGNAVYPAHYDRGWHITGTTGVFGSAAACGRLLGLSEQQMRWALGLAATQPVGLREMFGTMTKSFHPGRAAQNGLTSALLAKENFTSSDAGLEAKTGWTHVLSTSCDFSQITSGLGQHYEIALNTYKPFACGVVLHPIIDACLQLRAAHHLTPDTIERIDLRVHPLVLELTGKRSPKTGLESKFSVYFAAAVALASGGAGVKQFTDEWVRRPDVVSLSERVFTTVDPSIGEAQARATITLNDGRRVDTFVEHAVGSAERPMSDADLDAKVRDLCDGVLPPAQTRRVIDVCRNIEREPDVRVMADAARV